jgi:predicted SAM-dependent methyltransferase
MPQRHNPTDLRLNLGCGPIQPQGWINIDGSNRAWFASRFPALDRTLSKLRLLPSTEFNARTKFLNVANGLPFDNDSVHYVYAGELWEHLEHEIALSLATECYRILVSTGVLRICVPDGPAFWTKYLELCEHEMTKPCEERDAAALEYHTDLFFKDICIRRPFLGSMGHFHKWQYDEVQLVSLLKKAGFSCVERRKFLHSRIPDITAVERSDFLIVEAVK